MDRRIALVLIGLAATAPSAPARADCQCRANGTSYEQGEVACITTNAGRKLARCAMLVNIATWTIVADNCPSARAEDARLAASAAGPRPPGQPNRE